MVRIMGDGTVKCIEEGSRRSCAFSYFHFSFLVIAVLKRVLHLHELEIPFPRSGDFAE